MFTRPPELSDDDVVGFVNSGWDLQAMSAEYVPAGFGSHHWSIRCGGDRWFATIDDLDAKRSSDTERRDDVRRRLTAALSTARALADSGLDFVIAPVLAATGSVLRSLDKRFVGAVYPHVEGVAHSYGNYTTRDARLAVLDRVAELHMAPESCRSDALVDDFTIANRDALMVAFHEVRDRWDAGPFAEPARRLLDQHGYAVLRTIARYGALCDLARRRSGRNVVTHGEPHPANTIDTDDGVMLIDWDTVLLAPPERDVWDLVNEDPVTIDDYRERTGVDVVPELIELYRLRWDLSEIAVYISDFRRPHGHTDDTAEAWANLQHFLDPHRWANK